MDLSLHSSKVRAEISLSLALESRHCSRIDLSAFYKDLQNKQSFSKGMSCKDKVLAHLEILQSMSTFVYMSTKFD